MATVLQAVPGFQAQWDDHLAAHPGEPADLTLDLLELAAYGHMLLARRDEAELPAVLAVLEHLLTHGDEAVVHGARSGVIEGLLHGLAADSPELALLASGLGPRSRAYAQQVLRSSGSALPAV